MLLFCIYDIIATFPWEAYDCMLIFTRDYNYIISYLNIHVKFRNPFYPIYDILWMTRYQQKRIPKMIMRVYCIESINTFY